MATLKVVYATQSALDQMRGRYRKEDQDECMATSGHTAEESAQEGFEISEKCWVGLVDDKPAFIFGVARRSLLSSTGTPWLLGTEDIEKVALKFVKRSKRYIEEMFEGLDCLENFVDVRNTKSQEWLKWCGFIFDDAKPYGVSRLPFRKFSLRRS